MDPRDLRVMFCDTTVGIENLEVGRDATAVWTDRREGRNSYLDIHTCSSKKLQKLLN